MYDSFVLCRLKNEALYDEYGLLFERAWFHIASCIVLDTGIDFIGYDFKIHKLDDNVV